MVKSREKRPRVVATRNRVSSYERVISSSELNTSKPKSNPKKKKKDLIKNGILGMFNSLGTTVMFL